MTQREARAAYRDAHRAAGLCTRCPRPTEGRSMCEVCLAKSRIRARLEKSRECFRKSRRKWRENQLAKGGCIDCRNQALPGHRLCLKCIEKRRLRNKANALKPKPPEKYGPVAESVATAEHIRRMMQRAEKMPPVRLTMEDIYRRKPWSAT